MIPRKRIAYVTTYDATDIHKWSGLGYVMSKLLESNETEVNLIGNLAKPSKRFFKLKEYYYKYLLKKTCHFMREPRTAKFFSAQVEKCINPNTNLIFSPGTIPIAYLNTNIPKVFYTDATFAGMLDFYGGYTNLSKETIRHGHQLEQAAIDSSALAIYASDWAAQSAIEHYGANPDKVKVVPFGANLHSERTETDIHNLISKRNSENCELLFIGVDWERKGCNLAVEITKQLNDLGLKTRLNIVGLSEIPLDTIPDYIVNHGFISKATIEGRERINNLLAQSHFLIVPSFAEAYGLVFSEASSYGVPSLSHRVGGIPTVVRDGINGKTFELNTAVDVWCNYITKTFSDSKYYHSLCLSSFNEYQKRINWRVAGETIHQLLNDLVSK